MKTFTLTLLIAAISFIQASTQDIEIRGNRVDEFTFKTNLRSFNDVTLITCKDEIYFARKIQETVRFYLERDGKIIYEFPEMHDKYLLPLNLSTQILINDIKLEDLDNDGSKDLLVLMHVKRDTENGEDIRWVAELYLQQPYPKKFMNFESLHKGINDRLPKEPNIDRFARYFKENSDQILFECGLTQ